MFSTIMRELQALFILSCSFTQFITAPIQGRPMGQPGGGIFIIGCRSLIKEDWNRRHNFQWGGQTISKQFNEEDKEPFRQSHRCWCKVIFTIQKSYFHNSTRRTTTHFVQVADRWCWLFELTLTHHFVKVANADAKFLTATATTAPFSQFNENSNEEYNKPFHRSRRCWCEVLVVGFSPPPPPPSGCSAGAPKHQTLSGGGIEIFSSEGTLEIDRFPAWLLGSGLGNLTTLDIAPIRRRIPHPTTTTFSRHTGNGTLDTLRNSKPFGAYLF